MWKIAFAIAMLWCGGAQAQTALADPVVLVDPDGTPYAAGASGGVSEENVTQTPLGSAGNFTGGWEVNGYEHALVNVEADQPGTLYVEFGIIEDGADLSDGIDDSEVHVTFSGAEPIYADTPYFRSIVKGPGRAFRVIYTNGASAQSEFHLFTAYGQNLFPPSTSPDNELLVTSTPQERNAFVAAGGVNVAATGYMIFVDLDDTTNFPHDRTGRLDLSSVYISVDRDSSAVGAVRMCVITAIDGTDADYRCLQGVSFAKTDERTLIRDRNFAPSQLKIGVVGGELTQAVSTFGATGVTAINTGGTLTTSAGNTATPAVGDLIIVYEQSAGTYNWGVSAFYHGERTP